MERVELKQLVDKLPAEKLAMAERALQGLLAEQAQEFVHDPEKLWDELVAEYDTML